MNPAEMAQHISHAVLEATLASTAALLVVLLARRRLRAMFGASVAYAAWLLVPVALIAVLLPVPSSDSVSLPMAYGFIARPMQVVVATVQPSIGFATWLCLAWLSGAMAMLLSFIRQQRRFQRALGRLSAREVDVLQADAVAGLPAAVGWLNPVIVLPADFETRYTAEQRELMLVHERAHIRHGDLQANAAFVLMRCVFWFNPLVHVAAAAFRHDQELACDQRVIARHPHSRRAYGEAMFRTHLAAQALPLGCHWGFTHPLTERIAMLKRTTPSGARRSVGASLLVISLVLAGATTWASQAQTVADDGRSSVATPGADQVMFPPAYPKEEQVQGIGGMVVLIVDVAADGTVTKAAVERSSNNDKLDAAAMDAVKLWKFKPAVKDGRAVASRSRVPIEFRPEVEPAAPKNAVPTAPAKVAMVATGHQWTSYDRLVHSFNASWQPPTPPKAEGC